MEARNFIRLIKEEIISLPRNGILVFNACCLVALVFLIGFIYNKGVLGCIPTVVADLDSTAVSSNISRQFVENDKFSVTWANSPSDVLNTVNKGEAMVGLILPPGLSEDFKRQQGAEVLLIINGTNYIVANTAYAKAAEILQTLNAGIAIKTLEGKGFLPQEAQKTVQAIKLKQKILYNSDYNYAYYLTYGVLGAGVFSLLMSAVSITLSRQRKNTGFTTRELVAKLIVYGGFACIITNVIFRLAQVFFRLPAHSSPGGFFGLTLFYGYLIGIFALLLWVVAGDEVRIFQAGVFFATPLFFITGYTWPLESIPWFMRFLYWVCPFTPFLNGVRASLVMGADYPVVFKYMLWELALIVFYLPLTWSVYRRRLVFCWKRGEAK